MKPMNPNENAKRISLLKFDKGLEKSLRETRMWTALLKVSQRRMALADFKVYHEAATVKMFAFLGLER